METSFFAQKNNRVLGSLALLMVIIALGVYSMYTWKQTEYYYSGPTTIAVTGEGEVTAVPDIGLFNFSVTATGADAVVAREEANQKNNGLISFLKEKGVEEKDIKTESYSLLPKYRYEQRICPMGSYCPPGDPVLDGYEISQSISVKVRNLDQAGELLAGVGDLGATQISGLQFTIDDMSVLRDQARAEAIADAKARAEVLAEELGVKLEKMVGYSEDGGGPVPYYSAMRDVKEMSMEESAVTPDMPLGESVTKSNVTLMYQVR